MKIYNKSRRCVVNTFYKSIYIALFLCCSFIVKAQNQLITLSKQMTLKEAFVEIEKQTNLSVDYNDQLINANERIKKAYNNTQLNEVLNAILKDASCSYSIQGSHILITPKTAQQVKNQTITGTVTDELGDPIIGANVIEEGTTNGIMTDIDGKFSLSVSAGSKIQVSYIGYITQDIKVGNKKTFAVVLKEDSQALEEIVVVGYGTQKKGVVTGSIATAKGDDIIKSPTQNLGQALAGRLPGLIVTNGSGEPGADGVTINIRGKSTTGNNDPLILIDGIAGRGSLDRLNPNDIESITVLKDASAAIYGSRSANGVILVTTKRGKTGKPSISYSFNVGLQQPTRVPDLADAATFAEVTNELESYDGRVPRYTADEIELFRNGSDPIHYPNTNWADEVLKKAAFQQRHNVSVSGGTDAVSYYVGGGYSSQDGIFKNGSTKYEQYDIRSNIDAKITKDLKVSVDISSRLEDANFPSMSAGDIFWRITRSYPTVLAQYPNGLPTNGLDSNPIVMATDKTGYEYDKKAVFNGTITADWNLSWLLDGLAADAYMAYDRIGKDHKKWQTPWSFYTWDEATDTYTEHMNTLVQQTSLKQEHLADWSLTLNAKLKYKKTFGSHGIDAILGFEQNSYRKDNFWASRGSFMSTAIDQLFAGTSNKDYYDNSGDASESARRSYFGRVAYDFAGKYMAQFNFRYDGSYIFQAGQRWGFFPGVSAGWRMSEESFIKDNIDWINNLKIRGSFGKQGNDNIDPFQYLLKYNLGRNYVFGGTDMVGLYQKGFPNNNVTWEVADTWNIGTEGTFWNGLLGFEVEYFKTKRSNILAKRNASIPKYTGLIDLPNENIGRVQNQGMEIQLSHFNKIGEVNFRASGNFMFARNKVLFMDETPWGEGHEYMNETGGPMGAGLQYRAIGIFRDQAALDSYPHLDAARPGDLIFEDVDGDGKITSLDRVRQNLTGFPEIIFGLNLSADWKNFDISVLFQGQARAVKDVISRMDATSNFYKWRAEDRWTEDNIDGTMPRAGGTINYGVENPCSFWTQNASFVRLKNLEIGYTLPNLWFNKLRISNCRVYLSGQNLFTLDHIKYVDPEGSGEGSYYPQMRIFNIGCNLTF